MMNHPLWTVQDWWRVKKEKIAMALAWHLPRWLVKWAYVRVGAHATTGQYENTVVPELSMVDALKRWDD